MGSPRCNADVLPLKMKIFVIVTYWGVIAASLALLLRSDPPGQGVNTPQDILRLVLPVAALGVLFAVEKALRLPLRNMTEAIFRRCMAAPFLVFGLNWFCIFTLTNYRSHRRIEGLLLTAVFLAVGFGLAHVLVYRKAPKVEPPLARHPD